MKKSELKQIIREEISKTLNENQFPRKTKNLIKQHNAKDIYDLIDILKKKDSTIAEELKVTRFPFTINDENGNEIYFETAEGGWVKQKYDSKGNRTYFERFDGYWAKTEYDSQGNKIYYENSEGEIEDNR